MKSVNEQFQRPRHLYFFQIYHQVMVRDWHDACVLRFELEDEIYDEIIGHTQRALE